MMRLVIDSSIIIAALIRDSYSRKIILNDKFSFFCPEFCLEEIKKYKSLILEKSGLSGDGLNVVLDILFENIEVLSEKKYKPYLRKASREINDKKDVPFVALAMSEHVDGILSDDKDFDTVTSVKIFKTKNLITFS